MSQSRLKKSKRKKLILDINLIPQSAGFDVEKWMHYFTKYGIVFIDSDEYRRNTGREPTVSSGFGTIDISKPQGKKKAKKVFRKDAQRTSKAKA